MKVSHFILACFIISLISCQKNSMVEVDFLTGIWKIENKEQFEVWDNCGKNELKGYSYKFVDNKEHILETLSIKKIDKEIIYSATVPDQNDGKPVLFKLNPEIKDRLSFENPEHDFPKKIQYKKITDEELFVQVSGDNEDGFSYKIVKQKPTN